VLLHIVEENPDEREGFKVLAIGTLNLLSRDKEVHALFK
jgi:hypothetical protein